MYTETLQLSCVNMGSAGRVTQCLTKKTVTPNSGWALGDGCCTLQVSKDFIILKINVKITEKLSSVLLLNLEILQHQVFPPFVRERTGRPFSHSYLQSEELGRNIPNLWANRGTRDTVPQHVSHQTQKKLTMRLSTLDGDKEKVRVSPPVLRDEKALIRSPSLNKDKSHNSRMS